MFAETNPYNLKNFMKMNAACPVCGQPFDIEVGFYYGSGYVSYALSIAVSIASLAAWWMFVGVGLYDNRIFFWLAFNALLLIGLQPVIMRMARAVWLAIFIRYNANWQTEAAGEPERMNKSLQNGW